nr:MAG TPA: hypothetical protein [Caudoviricetes sp.]
MFLRTPGCKHCIFTTRIITLKNFSDNEISN